MRDELLTYYERELTYIRRLAAEFARKYPGVASRLELSPDRCEDPHVERLIEAFALLAARVHVRLDDDLPEVSQALLEVLFPHYLRPVPSAAIVEFMADAAQGKLASGYRIERNAVLYGSRGDGAACRFRTCYPVTLWPIDVTAAAIESGSADADGRVWPAAVTLRLHTTEDVAFSSLPLDTLRVFLAGEAKLTFRLYEALLGHCQRAEVRGVGISDACIVLSGDSVLREVGFSEDEAVLPYPRRSFAGYRLIQEFFHVPEKFLFVDVTGLSRTSGAGLGREVDLRLYLDAPMCGDESIEPRNFRLGCAPIVNLFTCTAEPIRLDQTRAEYRVVPDLRRQSTTEVYSIDAVRSVSTDGLATEWHPFYSFKHSVDRRESRAFWHATRRASEKQDDAGTEVWLSFSDLAMKASQPATDVVTVNTTCTNRGLAATLPFGQPAGDLALEGAAPLRAIRCVTKPSKQLRPPLSGNAQWRLISHLSLNYLSLVGQGSDADPDMLREMLTVYDFGDVPVVGQQIASIVNVSSQPAIRRIRTRHGSGVGHGLQTTIEFDEGLLAGSGAYLFSSVLDRFLGLYVSINSFSQLVATTRQRGVLKEWPPRSGHQALL